MNNSSSAAGYVEDIERRWNGGTYTYPAPTEKGRQRLEEGRLFGKEGDAHREPMCRDV